jgi:Raf kinase inhibitor-like YbhB/YbcL family protein
MRHSLRRHSPLCSGALVLALTVTYEGRLLGQQTGRAGRTEPDRPPVGLTLTSTVFVDGGDIPSKYTSADPIGLNPKLEWTNVPSGTAAFALIVHDADVSIQKTTEDVLHWLVFNIPGTARDLAEGLPRVAQLPDGTVQGKNLRGTVGYLGPGGLARPFHHYLFELFALDAKLGLEPDASRATVLQRMDGHILGKAILAGRFHR